VTALQSSLPSQVGLLSGRAIKHITRAPAQVIFPILFPLILLAVNTSGLDAATKLKGFPTDSYLDFALAIPFMQGALFAALNGGQDLARDIEGGFLDRLAMTPMSGAALLAGQLGGAMFMGAV
jgi:ABC-2 type transport system permease protein